MVKLIIFDWDDVFVLGAMDGYFACYRTALADANVHLGESELQRIVVGMWGQPHQLILKELLGGKNQALLPQTVARYQAYKKGDVFLGQLKFVPKGQQFLQRISKSHHLALATSQQRELLVERIFPMFKVPDVFGAIMSSHDFDDPLKAKPHPHMVEQLLKKFRVTPSEAIVVGDAKNDVRMAQAAGVEPVVVLTGHLTRQQAEELGVKHIIENVTLLEPELKKVHP